jgi:beta-glucuronidase
MLQPEDTATRERKRLDGLWRFAFDADGVGRSDAWWTATHEHVGDVCYRTTARVPMGSGRRRRRLPDDG